MTHAIAAIDPHKHEDSLVLALARECDTTLDLARTLYEEEIAALARQATIKQFIQVIAMKRVRDQLRELKRSH